jgi:hypothetical protein
MNSAYIHKNSPEILAKVVSRGYQLLAAEAAQRRMKMRMSNSAWKGRGAREGYFVYLPSMESETFLHLTIRGRSYRLRNFTSARPHAPGKAALLPGYPEIDHLRASGLVSRWIGVTPADLRQNVITKLEYWRARIAEVNAKEL